MKHQRDGERGTHELGDCPPSGNGAGVAAFAHNRGRGSWYRRVSIFGAAGALLIALFGLLGYIPGLGLLGSIREGYIPMAPSTAFSFIVLGGVLLAMTLRSLSDASCIVFGALAALVSLFGVLEVAGHFTGRDLNFEDALVPSVGHLGEIPIARMSPSTGAVFFLAGLAVLALVLRSRTDGRGTHLGHFGGGLGSLALGIGLLFCLAYLYGSPLLYGQGITVPMALTTALAFLMLGGATVGAAGEGAIPMSLLAGDNRVGKPISVRKRFLFLAFLMIAACGVGMTIMTVMLYRRDIDEHREQLRATAQAQARLIEAIARRDADIADMLRDVDPGHDPRTATLSQIIDAHDRYKGFGETGEFTLARRDGDSIVFILQHRHGAVEHPAPVAFDSDLAEPMRRALNGLSGTVIGLDYRGETVLAAHEPVAELNLGIVAKIDMAEIRAPFIRSGLTAAAIALLVVLGCTVVFFRIANPIIARLEANSRDLEKEVEERKRAEEMSCRLNQQLRTSIDQMPLAYILWDDDFRVVEWNHSSQRIFGYSKREMLGKHALDRIVPESIYPLVRKVVEKLLNGESASYSRDGNNIHKDGSLISCRWYNTPLKDEAGTVVAVLSMVIDVTDRKRAEKEREQLIAKLETQNAELERFTYTVSHDLKSPLITIGGYAGMLRKDLAEGDSASVENDLSRISNAANKMSQLLDDVLELSRIGRLVNSPEEVSLEELAREAFELVSGQVKKNGVQVDISPDLPVVCGDRLRLREVLQNLIDNGVKYMGDQAEPRIEVGSRRDDNETICYVRDNGIGIDSCYYEKVFGLFDQLNPKAEGTGIGLALVKRIVEVHGGRIWIESEGLGHGSTFCFTLAAKGESTDHPGSEPCIAGH